MKITNWKTTLGSSVVLLFLLVSLVGCGQNAADNGSTGDGAAVEQAASDSADGSASVAASDESRERELERKQQELDRRLADLERRENEMKRTERASTAPAPQPRRESPRQATKVARTQPETRTVVLTVPASTALSVEFTSALSSEESLVGDPVETVVLNDVVQDGRVAIPAGSVVAGQVTEVKPVKKIGGQAKVALDFQTLKLPSGETVAIHSSVEFVGKKQTTKDAATIGGSAAGGALLGRVLGGDNKDKGTAIGAVVGAAIGTAVAANNKTDPVLIESGATTDLLLYEPVQLTLVEQVPASAVASNR